MKRSMLILVIFISFSYGNVISYFLKNETHIDTTNMIYTERMIYYNKNIKYLKIIYFDLKDFIIYSKKVIC